MSDVTLPVDMHQYPQGVLFKPQGDNFALTGGSPPVLSILAVPKTAMRGGKSFQTFTRLLDGVNDKIDPTKLKSHDGNFANSGNLDNGRFHAAYFVEGEAAEAAEASLAEQGVQVIKVPHCHSDGPESSPKPAFSDTPTFERWVRQNFTGIVPGTQKVGRE